MPFLLGSFTSGLFGGARDMFDIANQWQQLKQSRLDTQIKSQDVQRGQKTLDASNAVSTALNTKGSEDTGVSATTPTTVSKPSAINGHYTPSDISSMPLPNFMKRSALQTSAGNQDYSAGSASSAQTQTQPPAQPTKQPFNSSALPTTITPNYLPRNVPGVTVAPNSPYASPAPRAPAAPAIGTPMNPPIPAQPNNLPSTVPGVTVAPNSPFGSTVPLTPTAGGAPGLANNMPGLGGAILNAINPTGAP